MFTRGNEPKCCVLSTAAAGWKRLDAWALADRPETGANPNRFGHKLHVFRGPRPPVDSSGFSRAEEGAGSAFQHAGEVLQIVLERGVDLAQFGDAFYRVHYGRVVASAELPADLR